MPNRHILAAVAIAFLFAATAGAAERPNVLLICIDDLKPLLACYGDKTVKSPNIDALAARGVLFERAYCNQAVCSPSRNALLVGLRPQTIGVYDLPTNFRKGAPDAVTLPQYFKRHGYRTESLGKTYHVGHGNIGDRPSWSVPSYRPKGSPWAIEENRPPTTPRPAPTPDGRRPTGPRGPAYESADVPDNAYPDGMVAEEAVRRLEAAAERDEPFFIAVGFVKPHLPFCAPKKYWDLYDRESFHPHPRQTPPDGAPPYAPTKYGELHQYRDVPAEHPLPDDYQRALIHGYHAAVSYMDAQVGKVIDALDATGLADNTIIVFWGDHGWHLGDHGQWCKHTNYEHAARIPLIVSAPGAAKNGRTRALVETVDVYPTLCELAGLPAPSNVDGQSFASVVRDPSSAARDSVIHVYPRGKRLGRAIRTERYRMVEWKQPGAAPETAEFELYDCVNDPDETRNIAAEQPSVLSELRAILAQHPEAVPQVKTAAATQ